MSKLYLNKTILLIALGTMISAGCYSEIENQSANRSSDSERLSSTYCSNGICLNKDAVEERWKKTDSPSNKNKNSSLSLTGTPAKDPLVPEKGEEVNTFWSAINDFTFKIAQKIIPAIEALNPDGVGVKKDEQDTQTWVTPMYLEDLFGKIMGKPHADAYPKSYDEDDIHTSKLGMYFDAIRSCTTINGDEDEQTEKMKIMLTHVTKDFLLDDGIRTALQTFDLDLKGEPLNKQLDLINTLTKIPSLDPTPAVANVVGTKISCNDIKAMAEPLGAVIPQMSCFGDIFLNVKQDKKMVGGVKDCLKDEGIELKIPKITDGILTFIDRLLGALGLADAIANLINQAVDSVSDTLQKRLKEFSSDSFLVCDYKKQDNEKWKRVEGSCEVVPNSKEAKAKAKAKKANNG